MAFTLKWKITLLVYILLNILIVFKILRYPNEQEDKSEVKRTVIIRRLRYVLTPISYVAWFIITVWLGLNALASPIADVVTETVTKTKYEKIYIYEGEDYTEEEWRDYWSEEYDTYEDDDWMDNIWGY